MGLIWIGLMFDSESDHYLNREHAAVLTETEFGDAESELGVLSCFSSIRKNISPGVILQC